MKQKTNSTPKMSRNGKSAKSVNLVLELVSAEVKQRIIHIHF